MKLLDWILLAIIAVWFVLAICLSKKNRCSENCIGCSGCDFVLARAFLKKRNTKKNSEDALK